MFVDECNRNLNTKQSVLSSHKYMMRHEADFRTGLSPFSMDWSTCVRIQVFGVSLHSALLFLVVLASECGRTVPENYPQLLLLGHWPDFGYMLFLKQTPGKKDRTIFKPGFLNLDTVDSWGQIIIFYEVLPTHARRFSSIPGCYPVNIIPPTQCDNPKYF